MNLFHLVDLLIVVKKEEMFLDTKVIYSCTRACQQTNLITAKWTGHIKLKSSSINFLDFYFSAKFTPSPTIAYTIRPQRLNRSEKESQ